MAAVTLYTHQMDAIRKMKNGCILCGGTGSGKSRASLAYFWGLCGGNLSSAVYFHSETYPYYVLKTPKLQKEPCDLYIITTAKKRDSHDWEGEMIPFGFDVEKDASSLYSNKVVVDSWNNIGRYRKVKGAFFIFDEQRVVGRGEWVKSFLDIAKSNRWILLSATPGDTWSDYVPVFLANGYFRNRTQFYNEHCVFARFTKYPKIERYIGESKLEGFRRDILVEMKFERPTVAHHTDIYTEYNSIIYKDLIRNRFDIWNNKPFQNAAEFCTALRRVVNTDESRQQAVLNILNEHPRAVIFYNYDYELEVLRSLPYIHGTVIAEWNGHKHEPVPEADRWVYLVQYAAGNEAWNCITTDTMIFYSQTYSYKVLVQACGRIDRMNTPYRDLYYYHLKSHASIDLSISRALLHKKRFNETNFCKPYDLKLIPTQKQKEKKDVYLPEMREVDNCA